MSKVQEKETEMEKLRQLKSELQNMMFDLEKEKSTANELRDKLDAKELATEQLDQKSKSLQRKLDIEVSNKQDLKSELDELKSSSTSIQVVVIFFESDCFSYCGPENLSQSENFVKSYRSVSLRLFLHIFTIFIMVRKFRKNSVQKKRLVNSNKIYFTNFYLITFPNNKNTVLFFLRLIH